MRRILLALALLVAGCAAPASTAPVFASPAFDLDGVKATLFDECATEGELVDVEICVRVQLLGLRADGATLVALTYLTEGEGDQADELCAKIAALPDAADHIEFGYQAVRVTDRIGRPIATCSVD